MQRLRGVLAGLVVGVPLSAFMVVWLHASRELAAVLAGIVGLAIFAVVATRSDDHDLAADAAWREATPDLPPVSERVTMELSQAGLSGPIAKRRAPASPKPAVAAKPATAVKSAVKAKGSAK